VRINTAVIAGLGVAALWASAFPAIRIAAPDLGVFGLSFVRLAVAAISLLGVAAACRVGLPTMRDLGWILACGFFGMTAYQVLLNQSELHVPAGTASIIVAAAPLVSVGVARILFDDRITPSTMVGSAVALGGITIVCLARAGLSMSASVWIVIGAMVVQGIYHPLQRPLLKTHSGLEVATYTMVAGLVMTLPFLPFGWSELVNASPAGWIAGIYLGLLPSALGFVLWAYVTARLPVAASTSLLYLVPPMAVFIAWLWLGEHPVAAELSGGLIVIAGVVIITQGGKMSAAIVRMCGVPHRLRSIARYAKRASPRTTRSSCQLAEDIENEHDVSNVAYR
jgi:drug/metabolite transporter (DMT)-like permease